jgi:hypothetical protein
MSAAEIAATLGEAHPEGKDWRCRCPSCGKASLSLRDGRTKLLIKCWRGCTAAAVRQELNERQLLNGKSNGHAPPFNGVDQAAEAARKTKTAAALDYWRHETIPITNMLGDTYLASRLLLQRPMPETLRFAPGFYHPNEKQKYPAVIGLLEHQKHGPAAIHAICVNPLDPSSKLTIRDRKISTGAVKGAACRLFPITGAKLAVGTGIENCLAFQQSTGIPAWAVPGDAFLAAFEPPPVDVVSTLILLEDQDESGRKAVAAASARFAGLGYAVQIARPLQGKDLCDALKEIGLDQPLCSIEDYQPGGVGLDDFHAYMPTHSYIYIPSREMWPAPSVNARIPPIAVGVGEDGKEKFTSAAAWLDRNRPVEQMTWLPGEPTIIKDRLVSLGGWIPRANVSVFNLYRPPVIKAGRSGEAQPWLDHIRKIYPDNADHIISWLAHRVQRPHDKINHALLLGGVPNIGKDTILEPVKHAVGPWNFQEVSPTQVLGRFTGFLKSVILRISEARDLGDFDRFQFYERMKTYTAAPPDVLLIDEKNLREYYITNCCGVVITTNYKTDGIHLPADDRRHYVTWSEATPEDFAADYWPSLYAWYGAGGHNHVAAYLASVDLTNFNPKAPPAKTNAFWEIVNSSRAPENAELADAIDRLGNPDILTISDIVSRATSDFAEWLQDRKNARRIPHRLEDSGYVAVRNNAAKDGLWKVKGKRQAIYGKTTLTPGDRIAAALAATT